MLTAKLLVPAGAPLQLSAGERLPPLQPGPFNTCSLEMVAPSLRSARVKVMRSASAARALSRLSPSAAIRIASFAMANPSLEQPGFFCSLPATTSHSNFRDGAEARDAIGERPRQKPSRILGRYHERSDPHPTGGR